MKRNVLDTLYSVNETLIDAADTLEGLTVPPHEAAGAYMRVLARETRAARVSVAAVLAALERAEGFISGFEDDDTQEGVTEMLAAIRVAIAKAKGEA
jgi:hypothetical protein